MNLDILDMPTKRSMQLIYRKMSGEFHEDHNPSAGRQPQQQLNTARQLLEAWYTKNPKHEGWKHELELQKERGQEDTKKKNKEARDARLGGRGARDRPAPKAAGKAAPKASVKKDKFDKTITTVAMIPPQARTSRAGSSTDTTNPKASTLAVVPKSNHRGELVLRG